MPVTRMRIVVTAVPLLLLLIPPAIAQTGGSTLAEKNAARFLTKATFGADLEMIRDVSQRGPKAWVEEQLELRPTLHQPFTNNAIRLTDDVIGRVVQGFDDEGFSETELERLEGNVYGVLHGIHSGSRRFAWWQAAMAAPDQLRQRVAFALSEIFVVSDRVEQLASSPAGMASYYDVLVRGAFGNYRDLLREVTLHPVMGLYLSHLNNAKSDPASGRFPDENYAREVMQLFSIGLFELASDGSRLLDDQGEPIPTYTNREITEFAKVFTGLGPGAGFYGEPFFGDEYPDLSVPMQMYEEFHEPGEKGLLRGQVVPAGQNGMEDVEDAIDNLFNHPNVGPFIGRRLIQRLVTSNPSPEYIGRVAAAFADNGEGVRGDMKAVVAAVLLDTEARSLGDARRDDFGHLQEPLLRYVHLLRAFGARSPSGFFLDAGYRTGEMLRQNPLSAPSVFNFFLPDHQPIGRIADRGLVAPEMQITTSATVISMANFLEQVLRYEYVMETPELSLACFMRPGVCDPLFRCLDDECYEREAEALYESGTLRQITRPFIVELDLDEEVELAENRLGAFLERIDLLLSQGRMSFSTRRAIRDAVLPLEDPLERVQLALYLALLSPNAAVAN